MAGKWDVVVAGAGPAGSATAALLARAGFSVLLVDRARFPREKACAEYMSPGVSKLFEEMGARDAVAAARPARIEGMEIISARRNRLPIEYVDGDRRWFAASLPRQTLDALLVEHACGRGVELREGWVARTPLLDGDTVAGIAGTWRGRQEQLSARLTIIADGSRSVLARALGLTRPPRWPVRLGLVAYFEGQARLNGTYGQLHVDRDGYCGIAPLPDGQLNVAMVVRANALRRTGLSGHEFFDRWIAERPSLRGVLAGCRRTTRVRGMVPVGTRSRRPYVPGALLVGDAAGFFDPFTGEGIYRALRSAGLAAHVGREALVAGDVSEARLRPYARARRQTFAGKDRVTALVQLFVQYPWLMDYGLPRLGRRPVPRRNLSLVLGDLAGAGVFLRPNVLWAALRP